MELKLNKKNFIFLFLIGLSVILWAYFLNSTGSTITEMLNLGEIEKTISQINSTNFIMFLLLFPLTIALTVIHCKTEENKINSFIVTISGALIGLVLSLLLFANMQQFILLGVFYLIALFLAVETIYVKLAELKKYVSLRLLGTAIHKTGTIIAIGLFLVVAMTVYENQEIYSEQIDDQLLKVAGGDQAKGQLTEYAIDLLIESQQQTAKQITELPTFDALETSADPNAVVFHAGIILLKEKINSVEYRQQITEEINKKQDVSDDQLKGVLASVKQQMPLFGLITEFLWLIQGFAFMSIFLLLSNTVFYVLTVIYGLIIEQIYGLINK